MTSNLRDKQYELEAKAVKAYVKHIQQKFDLSFNDPEGKDITWWMPNELNGLDSDDACLESMSINDCPEQDFCVKCVITRDYLGFLLARKIYFPIFYGRTDDDDDFINPDIYLILNEDDQDLIDSFICEALDHYMEAHHDET